MKKFWFLSGLLVLLWCLGGCSSKTQVVKPAPGPEETIVTADEEIADTPEKQAILAAMQEKGYDVRRKPIVLLVDKVDRKLTVFKGLTPLKTYPVVLGLNPKPDKLCQGDLCTPEGVYKVVTKYPHRRWSKFILIDYPNTQNWLRFSRAKQAGKLPPTAQIGGDVGIHGTEDDLRNIKGENWTWGCVSLRNKDVDDIYPLISTGTLVVIKK